MPVDVRAEGKGVKYVISILAYAWKENLKQMIEDGMLIRNRNFVQSAELVRSKLLCIILVSLPSYCLILMRSFTGCYDYLEHGLLTSRVPDSAEGC